MATYSARRGVAEADLSPGLIQHSHDGDDDLHDDDYHDDLDDDDTLKAGIPMFGFNDRTLGGLGFCSH